MFRVQRGLTFADYLAHLLCGFDLMHAETKALLGVAREELLPRSVLLPDIPSP
jgi:hypothetical protein